MKPQKSGIMKSGNLRNPASKSPTPRSFCTLNTRKKNITIAFELKSDGLTDSGITCAAIRSAHNVDSTLPDQKLPEMKSVTGKTIKYDWEINICFRDTRLNFYKFDILHMYKIEEKLVKDQSKKFGFFFFYSFRYRRFTKIRLSLGPDDTGFYKLDCNKN